MQVFGEDVDGVFLIGIVVEDELLLRSREILLVVSAGGIEAYSGGRSGDNQGHMDVLSNIHPHLLYDYCKLLSCNVFL